MQTILRIILIMSLLFSQLQPFVPVAYKVASNNKSKNDTSENVDSTEIIESTEVIDTESNNYRAKNYITLDLEGYCTIDMPQSHFTLDDSTTRNVYKALTYKDNRSRIVMSYVKDIGENTDMPGYITQKIAGVDTLTNDKSTEIHGADEREWMKVPSQSQEDNCNVYVYYTLSNNNTSAFWMKVKVVPESDDEEFTEVINQMLNTYSFYAELGTLFDEPKTGYYKDKSHRSKDGTSAKSYKKYRANDRANTVFKARGGYIKDADISENWQDLQVILDGTKFSLPSTYSTFTDAGYELNDSVIREEDGSIKVQSNRVLNLSFMNSKGTNIRLSFMNDSATESKDVTECPVIKIIIDSSTFTAKASTEPTESSTEENKSSNEHELILAGGVTWEAYMDDLIEYFGECTTTGQDNMVESKWKSGNKFMIIRTGPLRDIKYVEISSMPESYYVY